MNADTVIIATCVVIILIIFCCVCFRSRKETFVGDNQVVMIYSNSCPHCANFKPIFEKYKQAHPQIAMKEIDASSPEGIPFSRKVSGYPTTIVIDKRNEIIGNPLVGATSYEALAEFVDSNY